MLALLLAALLASDPTTEVTVALALALAETAPAVTEEPPYHWRYDAVRGVWWRHAPHEVTAPPRFRQAAPVATPARLPSLRSPAPTPRHGSPARGRLGGC